MRPESECRRPEFTEGYKVTLGDGQEWTFPKPVLRLLPVRKEAGGFGLETAPPFGPDYQAELTRYVDLAVEDEDSAFESMCLRVSLAATLLTRNYDLSDEEIQGLLYVEGGASEAAREMWSEVDAVVMGRAPKPSAVGSESPSSPTA